MLEKLFAAANAVKAGECLKNPATWKNNTMLMNTLVVIIGSIPTFIEFPMTDGQINSIAYGVVTVVGLYNTYIHAATSTKVGL